MAARRKPSAITPSTATRFIMSSGMCKRVVLYAPCASACTLRVGGCPPFVSALESGRRVRQPRALPMEWKTGREFRTDQWAQETVPNVPYWIVSIKQAIESCLLEDGRRRGRATTRFEVGLEMGGSSEDVRTHCMRRASGYCIHRKNIYFMNDFLSSSYYNIPSDFCLKRNCCAAMFNKTVHNFVSFNEKVFFLILKMYCQL
jgi:hypothetical protein